MNLTDKYNIEFDENNVILVLTEERIRGRGPKAGEVYTFTDHWFYPTIQMALKGFLQRHLLGSESVEEVLKRIEEVEVIIEKACQENLKQTGR